jgi:hypothetical protein
MALAANPHITEDGQSPVGATRFADHALVGTCGIEVEHLFGDGASIWSALFLSTRICKPWAWFTPRSVRHTLSVPLCFPCKSVDICLLDTSHA